MVTLCGWSANHGPGSLLLGLDVNVDVDSVYTPCFKKNIHSYYWL